MKTPKTNDSGEFKCPNCGSDLQLMNQNVVSWPSTNGKLYLHLHCSNSNDDSDVCEYDCYDVFNFHLRVDKDSPTGEVA